METTEKINWDLPTIKKTSGIIRAVNHKLRMRMIDLLTGVDSMSVRDIYTTLRLEQSVASQHLAILRRAGIVIVEPRGKFVYYSLDYEVIEQAQEAIDGFKLVGYVNPLEKALRELSPNQV